MIFNDNEIEELKKVKIYVDKREYSTDELWEIMNRSNRKKINKDLYDKIWYEVFGPPCSARWMPKEVLPKNIKKEDIVECPRCNERLKIMQDDNREEYYKCENCKYVSYIIHPEIKDELICYNTPRGDTMQISYIAKTPTAEEYNNLTEAVGWGRRENKIVEEALMNTLYSLCVYDEDKLIGYGRIIGDKTIFLYIHDVMVIPEYQGKGIGTGIMKELLNQVDEYKKINQSIRTYLGASKGKEAFYKKFGFISRPNENLGAGMILK